MKMLRIGTLCSGIGSPEEALKKLGIDFTVRFASDIDKKAKITYLANHECDIFYDDINNIDKNIPKTDIMIVGFPCQPFSLASSNSRGFKDERGQLIYKICEIICHSSPRFVIAENVVGLVTRDDGKTFAVIMGLFDSIGYDVHYRILNSLDFGVPQHRKRVYFVCVKKGCRSKFSFNNLSKCEYFPLRDILDKKVDGRFTATADFLSKEKVQKRIEGYSKDYAPCLTKTIARNGSSSEYISQVAAVNRAIGKKRKPTPRECARLHGFPESFIIPNSVCVTSQYEQFANTMTVPVVGAILDELL